MNLADLTEEVQSALGRYTAIFTLALHVQAVTHLPATDILDAAVRVAEESDRQYSTAYSILESWRVQGAKGEPIPELDKLRERTL